MHQLKPKIPYSYKDEYGNIINFTLDNYVKIYVPGIPTSIIGDNVKVFSGYLTGKADALNQAEKYEEYESVSINYLPNITEDLSMMLYAINQEYALYNINFEQFIYDGNPTVDYKYDELGNLIGDAGIFHQKRREVIIDTILQALEQEVVEHNTFIESLGISYVFNIPDVSRLEWNNTIDDISFLAFFQGMPIGVDKYYNNYALGGSRIVRTTYIYGDIDGYYHREFCPLVGDPNEIHSNDFIDAIFINRIHAAQEGYYPCAKCRP